MRVNIMALNEVSSGWRPGNPRKGEVQPETGSSSEDLCWRHDQFGWEDVKTGRESATWVSTEWGCGTLGGKSGMLVDLWAEDWSLHAGLSPMVGGPRPYLVLLRAGQTAWG